MGIRLNKEVKDIFLKTLKDDKEGMDKWLYCYVHELENVMLLKCPYS